MMRPDWTVTHTEGDKYDLGAGYDTRLHSDTEHVRHCQYAFNGQRNQGVSVKGHYNYPGSPAPAFGQTGRETAAERKWPAVTAFVPLPAGRTDLRDELVQKFQDVIDTFITAHGLA